MSQSGYTPWAVTAGEIPTTAFWNILGSNDAAFNTGNGLNDGAIINRHIGSTFVSAGKTTYTNTGTAGGTFNYMNFGGVKMLWGVTNVYAIVGSGNQVTSLTVAMPNPFFTTIETFNVSVGVVGATNFLTSNLLGLTLTLATIELVQTAGGTGTAPIYVWAMGT